jgi:hypothetical protein
MVHARIPSQDSRSRTIPCLPAIIVKNMIISKHLRIQSHHAWTELMTGSSTVVRAVMRGIVSSEVLPEVIGEVEAVSVKP